MRIGYRADATAAACWWLEEIDGLMILPEGADQSQREVMTRVGSRWRIRRVPCLRGAPQPSQMATKQVAD